MKVKNSETTSSPLGIASALRDALHHPGQIIIAVIFMMAAAGIWLAVTTPLYSAEGELFIRGAIHETHYDNGHPFLADIGLSGQSVDFSDEAIRLTTPSLLMAVADSLDLRVRYKDSRLLRHEYIPADRVPVIVEWVGVAPTFTDRLSIEIEGDKVRVRSGNTGEEREFDLDSDGVTLPLAEGALRLRRNARIAGISYRTGTDSGSGSGTGTSSGSRTGLDWDAGIDSYTAEIVSMNTCVRELRDNMSIYTPIEWNPILRCVVRAPSRSEAVAILSTLQQVYSQEYRQARRDTLTSVLNYLEARADTLRAEPIRSNLDEAQRMAKDSVYRYVQLRIEQTRLALGHDQDNNGWYTRPIPSDGPVYPKPFAVLLAAFVVGLLIVPVLHFIVALFEPRE